MNIRIDTRILSLQDRAERFTYNSSPAAPQAGEPDGTPVRSASLAVRSQNLEASKNPLPDAAAAAKAVALIRSQVTARPKTALAAHQLSPRSVSSLLS